MARGRKPDTAELQAAKGNPSKTKRRTAASPAPVSLGNIKPPRWLSKSRKAIEVWNELVPLLARLNFISELDAVPFGRYCRYVVEWIVADQAVRKEGTWYDTVGTNGEATKKRHPAWQACQDLEKMLREIEDAFGMRPDSRYKILRDQAAAGAGLPLFPDGTTRGEPNKVEGPAEPVEQQQDDVLGILGQFDSVPPNLRN